MKRVILLRGLPGAGKSTEAKKFNGYIVSADDYFMVDGVYHFDPRKLGDAHVDCMKRFLHALVRQEAETIVVDNTNTRLYELNPYRMVALASGYTVEVVRMVCDPEVCVKRNTHGVSRFSIIKMWEAFENMPSFLGGERVVVSV